MGNEPHSNNGRPLVHLIRIHKSYRTAAGEFPPGLERDAAYRARGVGVRM